MKAATLLIRSLVGLVFVVFGMNYFLNFIPMPAEMPEAAQQYMEVFAGSGMLKVIKILEITGGLMLLTGFFALVGIAILLPISINILLYDLYIMQQPGLGIPLVVLNLFLIIGYWRNSRFVFSVYPPLGRTAV